jgi:hypothetical protein
VFNEVEALLRAGQTDEYPTAWFVGPLPDVGPMASLHVVFKPAAPEGLARVEGRVPASYVDLLRRYNGAHLFRVGFSYAVSFFGSPVPGPIRRGGGREATVPWDVLDYNRTVASGKQLVVGSWFADGSNAVLDQDGTVRRRSRDGARLSGEWGSLEEWLGAEITRLASLYDSGFGGSDLSQTLPAG